MILRPQTTFTIVRQLARPLEIDPTVFYVRAVVRNAYSGATLATLNLADQGSNRFTYNYQVPNDPGNGLWISITTSVYEDSGYTTKGQIYGDDEKTCLVERLRTLGGGSGGGTSWMPDKDFWNKLAQLIADSVKIPEQQKIDLSKIVQAINAIPTITGYSTSAEIKMMAQTIADSIDKLPKKEVNLDPIVQEIQRARAEMLGVVDQIQSAIKAMQSGDKQEPQKLSDINNKIENIIENLKIPKTKKIRSPFTGNIIEIPISKRKISIR